MPDLKNVVGDPILLKSFCPKFGTFRASRARSKHRSEVQAVSSEQPHRLTVHSVWCHVPAHAALAVRKFWGTKSVAKLGHSPHSPDLAPCLAIPKPDDRSKGFLTLLALRGKQELSITFGQ